SRIPGSAIDCFRENRERNSEGTFPKCQNHQHLSLAHPGKNGDEEQRRADALRHAASIGGVIASCATQFHRSSLGTPKPATIFTNASNDAGLMKYELAPSASARD